MPTIGDLILQHRARTGATYRDLARASGDRLSHQRWNQLGNNQRIDAFPEPETIRVIAETIHADHTDVLLGFAVVLGLDVRAPGAQIPIPAGAEKLDGVQRRVIYDTILAFLPHVTEEQVKANLRRARQPRGQGQAASRKPSA